MTKFLLHIFAIIVISMNFISCTEDEVFTEENPENAIKEIVYAEGPRILVEQKTQEIHPNSTTVLMEINIENATGYRLSDFEILIETSLGEFLDHFQSIRLFEINNKVVFGHDSCLLYTSPSPRDA